jgi:hypothetical protein
LVISDQEDILNTGGKGVDKSVVIDFYSAILKRIFLKIAMRFIWKGALV